MEITATRGRDPETANITGRTCIQFPRIKMVVRTTKSRLGGWHFSRAQANLPYLFSILLKSAQVEFLGSITLPELARVHMKYLDWIKVAAQPRSEKLLVWAISKASVSTLQLKSAIESGWMIIAMVSKHR